MGLCQTTECSSGHEHLWLNVKSRFFWNARELAGVLLHVRGTRSLVFRAIYCLLPSEILKNPKKIAKIWNSENLFLWFFKYIWHSYNVNTAFTGDFSRLQGLTRSCDYWALCQYTTRDVYFFGIKRNYFYICCFLWVAPYSLHHCESKFCDVPFGGKFIQELFWVTLPTTTTGRCVNVGGSSKSSQFCPKI